MKVHMLLIANKVQQEFARRSGYDQSTISLKRKLLLFRCAVFCKWMCTNLSKTQNVNLRLTGHIPYCASVIDAINLGHCL